jgi:pimeloyl-ACP methyl ester carboxylesterase
VASLSAGPALPATPPARRWPSRFALGAALLLAASVSHADAAPRAKQPLPADSRELVVVLHGLGRSPISMRPITRALQAAGYDVMPFGYSSYCCAIPAIVADLRAALHSRMGPEHARVHFVGHSLGNILVRYLLASDSAPPRVGRVVMLAPPNQGALRADRMTPVVGWLLKPTPELRVDSTATVRGIPPVRGVEIGVIAGRDDDTVKLPETHLAEEKEHIVVEGGHTFIMNRRDVRALTIAFLRNGTFGADSLRDTTRTP